MVRFAVAQLRFRPGRSVALLLVLVTTVACFALVGSSAKTEQVSVQGTLQATSRTAYDLLVRPAGSVTQAERQGNLVSSTAMSGIDGGITLGQWHEIEQIPGVYAAAPVAVVGYDYLQYEVEVHVPDLAPGQSQVLYRLAPTFVSENGLTRIPAEDEYVYITSSPLASRPKEPAPAVVEPDGGLLPICQVSADDEVTQGQVVYVPACGSTSRDDSFNTPSVANPYATGPATGAEGGVPTGVQYVTWNVPFLVEAIDPVQEARLDGLDHAITVGSYLSSAAGPVTYSEPRPDAQTQKNPWCSFIFNSSDPPGTPCRWTTVPVLAADAGPMQESLQVTIERMPQSAAAQVGDGDASDILSQALPVTAAVARTGTVTVTDRQAYSQLLAQLASKNPTLESSVADFATLMTAAPISYTSGAGTQVPRTVSLAQVLGGIAFALDTAIDSPTVAQEFPELADTAVRQVAWHGVTFPFYAPDKPPGGVEALEGWDNDPHPGAATAQIPGRNRRRRGSRTSARTPTRLAAANIVRVPGRSVLAATGVALAVAGLTLIAVLVTAFHGQTSGTLLGQAIIVQVHAADYLAAGICAVLGLALARDIAYTATRDRAGEHALLRATGWTPADLTRLAGLETALTATVGATVGAVLPVAGVWAATGAAPAAAITAAAAIAIGAVLATMLTALLPARRLMRTAQARHLAET